MHLLIAEMPKKTTQKHEHKIYWTRVFLCRSRPHNKSHYVVKTHKVLLLMLSQISHFLLSSISQKHRTHIQGLLIERIAYYRTRTSPVYYITLPCV
jgi:hypothetical protein